MWKECVNCGGKVILNDNDYKYHCRCGNGFNVWQGTLEESAKEWHRLEDLRKKLVDSEKNVNERQYKMFPEHSEERTRLIWRSVHLSDNVIKEIERKLEIIEKHILKTVLKLI